MTAYEILFCHCELSEAISSVFSFTEHCCKISFFVIAKHLENDMLSAAKLTGNLSLAEVEAEAEI